MKQEHVSGRDIKEALIVLLREKYGLAYKYYSRQDVEGMVLPAFFVDVRLTQRKDETINIVSKSFVCRIMYFQEDPAGQNADADQYEKIEEISGLLSCDDVKRNPRGGMVLKVKGRFLTISEYGVDYIGKENNILEASFSLEFYDFKEDYREEDELMEELSFKEKLEE